MAYVFHGNVTNVPTALHECLVKWSGWTTIETNVLHTLADTVYASVI